MSSSGDETRDQVPRSSQSRSRARDEGSSGSSEHRPPLNRRRRVPQNTDLDSRPGRSDSQSYAVQPAHPPTGQQSTPSETDPLDTTSHHDWTDNSVNDYGSPYPSDSDGPDTATGQRRYSDDHPAVDPDDRRIPISRPSSNFGEETQGTSDHWIPRPRIPPPRVHNTQGSTAGSHTHRSGSEAVTRLSRDFAGLTVSEIAATIAREGREHAGIRVTSTTTTTSQPRHLPDTGGVNGYHEPPRYADESSVDGSTNGLEESEGGSDHVRHPPQED